MWTVILTKMPKRNDFRAGYFPRTLFYKRDAMRLAQEVRDKGGEAIVVVAADEVQP